MKGGGRMTDRREDEREACDGMKGRNLMGKDMKGMMGKRR